MADSVSILDQSAETADARLWLVSNPDGTREIVSDGERAGRGGFAPAYGQPYRVVLAEMVKSLQKEARTWLEIHAAYLAGKTMIAGPLGGSPMPAVCFVAGAHVYTAYIGKHHRGHFLGFGGRVAKITMADGAEYESNNVWSARDVPPDLRGILRDNATIKWEN